MIQYSKLNTLKFGITRYFGNSYYLYIDFKNLRSKYKFGEGSFQVDKEIVFIPSKLREFVDRLNELKLLNWNAEYKNIDDIKDGTNWYVEIVIDNCSYKYKGDNNYPEKWDEFCKLIEKLIGNEFK